MCRRFLIASFLGLAASAFGSRTEVLTSVADLNRAQTNLANASRPFDLTATVLYANRRAGGALMACDDSGAIVTMWDFCDGDSQSAREAWRMRLRGFLESNPNPAWARPRLAPACTSFEALAPAELPPPRLLSADQLRNFGHAGERVALTGVLRDVFRDEIDPNYVFLSLRCGKEDVSAAFAASEDPNLSIKALLGAHVALSGLCPPKGHKPGRHDVGRHLGAFVYTHPELVKPVADRSVNPFAAPPIADNSADDAESDASPGYRTAAGTVLARWGGLNALLRTDDGLCLTLALAHRPLPDCGARILAAGIPSTDIYQTCLHHAQWRAAAQPPPVTGERTKRLSIRDLVKDRQGRPRYDIRLHGSLITLRGRLILSPSEQPDAPRFFLEQDGEIAPIDASAIPGILSDIPNGSVVELSGICVMTPQSGLSLPRISGFFVVPRTAADLCLLARPPWWTPEKVAVLLLTIFAALAGLVVWGALLKRISERRGEELANEKLALAESRLKIDERTRLAVELHDLLSQMLSGISMQTSSVRKFFDTDRERARHHLDLATKTLLVCRKNLRDCLWDLRSHALEAPDMDTAIRKTLEPHIENADLDIRFDVPRDRLTDNTAHTILCIVRELALNALRHGQASVVRIVGGLENGTIRLSVTDNGRGFDPAAAPGMAQGHFGLQGVRERIESLEGKMSITSAAGRGTRVSLALNLPKEGAKEFPHG